MAAATAAAAAAAAGHTQQHQRGNLEGKGAEPDQRNTACIQLRGREDGRKEGRSRGRDFLSFLPSFDHLRTGCRVRRLKPHFRCNERDKRCERGVARSLARSVIQRRKHDKRRSGARATRLLARSLSGALMSKPLEDSVRYIRVVAMQGQISRRV